eukprot:1154639-Pelagomonas_calceolata.AAC.1
MAPPPRGTHSRTVCAKHRRNCITCFENNKCAITVIQHDRAFVQGMGSIDGPTHNQEDCVESDLGT